ncbi:hypothetical protein LIER_20582 [Lithospermum erythrorhizon]|uniref:Uncharacterized protein n=1 Tax=Lithospermum erythrorhizon TaxID=34254 RepID=A0AAV3QR39_LITER
MDETIPTNWVPCMRPKDPKRRSPLSWLKLNLRPLRRVFDQTFHYKVFCEEGVIIHAGLIRSKEYDPNMKTPVSWDPCDVSFSTMVGELQPMFQKRNVLKKNMGSSIPAGPHASPSTAACVDIVGKITKITTTTINYHHQIFENPKPLPSPLMSKILTPSSSPQLSPNFRNPNPQHHYHNQLTRKGEGVIFRGGEGGEEEKGIMGMAPNKSLGPDEFPTEFF